MRVNEMKIEKINWISREGQEAEVLVSDGDCVCAVFCQPCEYEEQALVAGPLHAFMTKHVMLSRRESISLKRIDTKLFAYECTAHVLDSLRALVSIGSLEIELDDRIPAGVNNGDLVDFECSRIDIW
jgi:hypothetical protein